MMKFRMHWKLATIGKHKMFNWIKSLFEKKYKTPSGFSCPHTNTKSKVKITVFGKEIDVGTPFCQECTQAYMNRYATVCAQCGDAILVGEPVGAAHGAKYNYPYVHLTYQCTFSGGQFCGHWGEGKLNGLDG